MKVERVQNNNTTFNAKLNIHQQEQLLSNLSIAQLKNYAKSIGKAKDEICINIGKLKEEDNQFLGEQGALGCYGTLTECKMDVSASIGGEEYNKDLSWHRVTKYVAPESIIMHEIQDYLQALHDTFKHK